MTDREGQDVRYFVTAKGRDALVGVRLANLRARTNIEHGALHEEAVTRAVKACRDAGVSWTDIAQALGVTRQAARKRFAGKVGA